MTRRWEAIEHTADLALRVYGWSLPDLFVNAALALFEQVDPGVIQRNVPTLQRQVRVEGDDCEALLVNWLNELLYLHETHHEAYSRFEVQTLCCEPGPGVARHDPGPQPPRRPNAATGALCVVAHGASSAHPERLIKAATFHGLRIERNEHGLTATLVFDV